MTINLRVVNVNHVSEQREITENRKDEDVEDAMNAN